MKRRNFLGNLTALIVAPGLFEGVTIKDVDKIEGPKERKDIPIENISNSLDWYNAEVFSNDKLIAHVLITHINADRKTILNYDLNELPPLKTYVNFQVIDKYSVKNLLSQYNSGFPVNIKIYTEEKSIIQCDCFIQEIQTEIKPDEIILNYYKAIVVGNVTVS